MIKILFVKLLFSFLIILFLLLNPISAFAKTSSESAQKKVNYSLPYPGMLPDHPLYKIKQLRDKIIPTFIQSKEKKVDFYLLQADKGFAAAEMLAQQGKWNISSKTILKAENFLTLISNYIKDNRVKLDTNKFKKLEKATLKHQEVAKNLQIRAPEKNKKSFKNVIYFSKKNLEEIKNALHSIPN